MSRAARPDAEPDVDDDPEYLTRHSYEIDHVQCSEEDLTPRERWCTECNARVMKHSEKKGEQYGHDPTCKHTIRHRDDHDLDPHGGES